MERVRGDTPSGIDVHRATVDGVNGRSEERRHRAIGVGAVEDNCRKEWAAQSSASLVPYSSRVEEDIHLVAVAWHVVKDEGGCVPWAIVVDDSLLDRLEDGEGIGLQGDCHLRPLDWAVQTSRELTFDRLSSSRGRVTELFVCFELFKGQQLRGPQEYATGR